MDKRTDWVPSELQGYETRLNTNGHRELRPLDLLSVPLRNATPEELKAQGESLARNYKPGPRQARMVVNRIVDRKLVPTVVESRPTLDDLQRENGDTVETAQQTYTRGYEAGYHAALMAVRAKTNVLLDGLVKGPLCKYCKKPGKKTYQDSKHYIHAHDEDYTHCGRYFEGMDGL